MSTYRKFSSFFVNYDNPESIGSKLRIKRAKRLVELIESTFNEHGLVNIVDIGGWEFYWKIVPEKVLSQNNVKITIVNIFTDKTPENHGIFNFINADGCHLSCFNDKSFHIAHSNSVVEHVGNWNRMKLFANEIMRVSEKYYVQTPNYWFPIEPHVVCPFFHWLPRPIQLLLLLKFQLGFHTKATSVNEAMEIIDDATLLNKTMFKALFVDARIITEWFLFLPKSLIAIKK